MCMHMHMHMHMCMHMCTIIVRLIIPFSYVGGAGLYRGNFGRHGDNSAAAMAACERRS